MRGFLSHVGQWTIVDDRALNRGISDRSNSSLNRGNKTSLLRLSCEACHRPCADALFHPGLALQSSQSYQPHVPEEHRTWEYRQKLMKEYLLTMNADVVCVQEASAETFESDFGYMKDAG